MGQALTTAGKVIGDKAKSEIKDMMIKQILKDATGEAGIKTFKTALGWTTLFLTFVETYAKAVKEANLEMVKRNYECCPHIGQCENYGHAISIASKTTATVWYVEGFYYFHPQLNYLVNRSTQIMRTTENGFKIEDPRRPEFKTEDCWACHDFHENRPRFN